MYETIYKIEETEVLLDVKTEGEIRNFRNLSRDFWVTNLEFPTKFYYTLLSIPMIRLFPADYRFWLTNLKVLLGNNKHSPYSYRNLIGHFFHWFFSKTIKSNIKADAFFLKRKNNYVVLFYLSKKDPSIIKVNIEKKNRVKFKKQIEKEITSQLSALNIIHKDVFIPKILKYNTNSDLLYIEQQFLTHCKDIIFLSVSKKQEVLDKVMDFMYHFYIKNNLKGVKINKNVYNQKLKNIENLYKTDKILNIVFNKLSQLFMEDKIMFWCRIHNDLVH